MITLSGLVPGEDIEIVYTGLRPGEKLYEELLTEEEEQTHAVRDRIQVTQSPPPPDDLALRLVELRRLADVGDAGPIVRAFQALVPSYSPRRAGLPFGVPAAGRAAAAAPVEPRPRASPTPPRARADRRPLARDGIGPERPGPNGREGRA